MKRFLTSLLILATASVAQAQNAEEIMKSVRQVAALQDHQDLHGQLKKGGTKIPFSILTRGKEIHFKIDKGKDAFALRLGEEKQDLFDTTGGKARKFPDQKIVREIGGTNVSYEDLALKFLYWPNPRIAGEAVVKTQSCWRIHVVNPDKTGRYREISVWVSKKQRALMRVIGYGAKPTRAALKQFEVLDIMKRGKTWTAKRLQISEFNEKGRSKGVTYIDFGKKKRRRR